MNKFHRPGFQLVLLTARPISSRCEMLEIQRYSNGPSLFSRCFDPLRAMLASLPIFFIVSRRPSWNRVFIVFLSSLWLILVALAVILSHGTFLSVNSRSCCTHSPSLRSIVSLTIRHDLVLQNLRPRRTMVSSASLCRFASPASLPLSRRTFRSHLLTPQICTNVTLSPSACFASLAGLYAIESSTTAL